MILVSRLRHPSLADCFWLDNCGPCFASGHDCFACGSNAHHGLRTLFASISSGTLYPSEEENIIGSYEAGESRTQIIVNSWSGDSTLQSMSG